MVRRLFLLVGLVIALVVFPATTGVAAVVHSYDGQITTRVDAHRFEAIDAGAGLFSDAPGGSTSPPAETRGTPTTPLARNNATNAGTRLLSPSSLAGEIANATGGVVKTNKGGFTVNVPQRKSWHHDPSDGRGRWENQLLPRERSR